MRAIELRLAALLLLNWLTDALAGHLSAVYQPWLSFADGDAAVVAVPLS